MTLEQRLNYVGDTIHEAKDQKPTNDKPNIYDMDFHINLKNFIRQIKQRLQLMKTIEGMDLNIQVSVMLLTFICRSTDKGTV